MNVLVDTSVWSLAFRRRGRRHDSGQQKVIEELAALIEEMRAQIAGCIRQELLLGITEESQFSTLRDHLRAFIDVEITTSTHELAAELFNACRKKGVQGSHVDFLICAIAKQYKMSIFSVDDDFKSYARHCNLKLHHPR